MRSPRLFVVWLVVVFSAAGLGDIVYLSRQRNTSVEFSCVSTHGKEKPFAFSLIRDWVKPDKVLYMNFGASPTIFNERDKNRILVQSGGEHQQVNVNITFLLGRHTDLYRCVFHYDYENMFMDHPGKTKYFLYVDDVSIRQPQASCCPPKQIAISQAKEAEAAVAFKD
ncbi:hypothetical protein NFI96_015142 [Prochilodus magdalenae]|nr:hypothetical protein NFI96_015142 [Prochilodus magdalenae]